MASRDKSQGFGFVYLNVKELLEKKDGWDDEVPLASPKAQTVNFNKDPLIGDKGEPKKDRAQITQIRENLDRLQSLHQRLHSMLEELNSVGKKKGGKDS